MTYKILIVEDDLVIREQLQLLLAGSGYRVETAGDAAAALARMQSFAPHLEQSQKILQMPDPSEISSSSFRFGKARVFSSECPPTLPL